MFSLSTVRAVKIEPATSMKMDTVEMVAFLP